MTCCGCVICLNIVYVFVLITKVFANHNNTTATSHNGKFSYNVRFVIICFGSKERKIFKLRET